MTTPIISVEHLSKRYHLGQIGATTLRESAQHLISRIQKRMSRQCSLDGCSPVGTHLNNKKQIAENNSSNDLWALRDVSFEVQPGEVLGIIGRNGAGKSTLLKILSRITEPTSGRAILRGRVASLLEVGTGFHPELTGRENIFLNGAILGMKKAEIARKFDEIVAFSEVERFIDTPVKRYSSGMYVRLAFAVAAHLDPEILLVDEVLAVGDTAFQAKCTGKIDEVAKGGRTIIFISHNMSAVKALCRKCVYIHKGRCSDVGMSEEVISKYLSDAAILADTVEVANRSDRFGTGAVRITHMSGAIDQKDKAIRIKIRYETKRQELRDARLLISINSAMEHCIAFLDSGSLSALPNKMPSHGDVEVQLSSDFALPAGDYSCNVACLIGAEIIDHVQHACRIHVGNEAPFGWRRLPTKAGSCYVKQSWFVRAVEAKNDR